MKEGNKWRKICTKPNESLSKTAFVACGQLGFPDGKTIKDTKLYLLVILVQKVLIKYILKFFYKIFNF